jgi:hypothetical protein
MKRRVYFNPKINDDRLHRPVDITSLVQLAATIILKVLHIHAILLVDNRGVFNNVVDHHYRLLLVRI